MSLPAGVDHEQLRRRIEAVRQATEHAASAVPGPVRSALAAVAAALRQTPPDLPRAGRSAAGILTWYFDQGFSNVPAHAAVGDLALDVVKMDRVIRARAQVQDARSQPGAPEALDGVERLLERASDAFDAEGRLLAARYDPAARELRDLVHSSRAALVQAVDSEILMI